MERTKVFILDDSALMRQMLTEILASDPGIEVVGAAADPYAAWPKMRSTLPDVLTLDVEMPRMDGITFLEKLMHAHPMPVVMVSSLTERGCDTTLRALELGAVDFVTKPRIDVKQGTMELGQELIDKVKAAARARVVPKRQPIVPLPEFAEAPRVGAPMFSATYKVIALGASTGGTQALEAVLTAMPADAPGIVIVQHMPEKFTTSFAARLNELCRIRVKEASHGDRILPGHALLAPGNYHMRVVRSGANYSVTLDQEEPINRHRPSVDALFHSCAKQLGQNAVSAIMTGMGDDGARGMVAMRQAGAHTIAQNEATCVVFGMPREAIAMGGAIDVLPLDGIAARTLSAAGHGGRSSGRAAA
jgi:two-component system, chemotaxis family, protein-glutamate methylesterase/glutaminase